MKSTTQTNKNISRIRAKARRKYDTQKEKEIFYTLHEVNRCLKAGDRWPDLTMAERVTFEEWVTETLLKTVRLFNRYTIHSLKYGLRELDQEEIEKDAEE